jgi:hypothetical protein
VSNYSRVSEHSVGADAVFVSLLEPCG